MNVGAYGHLHDTTGAVRRKVMFFNSVFHHGRRRNHQLLQLYWMYGELSLLPGMAIWFHQSGVSLYDIGPRVDMIFSMCDVCFICFSYFLRFTALFEFPKRRSLSGSVCIAGLSGHKAESSQCSRQLWWNYIQPSHTRSVIKLTATKKKG